MADNHITVNTSLRLGFEAQNVANIGATYRHHLSQLKSAIDAMDDGGSRVAVETAFGLTPGNGPTFVFLVANALAALNAATASNQYIDYLSGVGA